MVDKEAVTQVVSRDTAEGGKNRPVLARTCDWVITFITRLHLYHVLDLQLCISSEMGNAFLCKTGAGNNSF